MTEYSILYDRLISYAKVTHFGHPGIAYRIFLRTPNDAGSADSIMVRSALWARCAMSVFNLAICLPNRGSVITCIRIPRQIGRPLIYVFWYSACALELTASSIIRINSAFDIRRSFTEPEAMASMSAISPGDRVESIRERPPPRLRVQIESPPPIQVHMACQSADPSARDHRLSLPDLCG